MATDTMLYLVTQKPESGWVVFKNAWSGQPINSFGTKSGALSRARELMENNAAAGIVVTQDDGSYDKTITNQNVNAPVNAGASVGDGKFGYNVNLFTPQGEVGVLFRASSKRSAAKSANEVAETLRLEYGVQ